MQFIGYTGIKFTPYSTEGIDLYLCGLPGLIAGGRRAALNDGGAAELKIIGINRDAHLRDLVDKIQDAISRNKFMIHFWV